MNLPDPLESVLKQVFSNPRELIQQNEWEIRTFLGMAFEELKPKRTLELGTWRATNAVLLSLITEEKTITVDYQRYGNLPLEHLGHNLQCMLADGHDPKTVALVTAMFSGPLDLLFIDDGHCIEEVTADHKLWAPLVRPGGWIAFHDINFAANQCAPGVHPSICQAHAYWASITGNKQEIIDPNTPAAPGIGIIRV